MSKIFLSITLLFTVLYISEKNSNATTVNCINFSTYELVGTMSGKYENYDSEALGALCDEKFTTPKHNCNDNCKAANFSSSSTPTERKMQTTSPYSAPAGEGETQYYAPTQGEMQPYPMPSENAWKGNPKANIKVPPME